MTIQVFRLDEHEIIRYGLQQELLEATDDIVVIDESGSAPEAGRRIPFLGPDVAIFDARVPDASSNSINPIHDRG
jgi:DNA-binding NarL/FixJ family response regulator